MNTEKKLFFTFFFFFFLIYRAFALEIVHLSGDANKPVIKLELEQLEDGAYLVSMISDTGWTFPDNIVSTAQITLKAPAGQFEIGEVTNLIDGVVFFQTGTIQQPVEAPDYDYFSISLGAQGTSSIPFEKDIKVALFSVTNILDCTDGLVSLMDNNTDPFYPPNELDANFGQQMTVSGYNLADIPIGIRGEGINCTDLVSDSMAVLSYHIALQDISCAGETDGRIIVKGRGGVPDYKYLWSTGDTLADLNNLAEGTYQLTITDAVGDTVVTSVTIDSPEALSASFSISNVTNPGATDGRIITSVKGGIAPYQYSWSNGADSAMLNNLAEGVYQLTLTDANNCRYTDFVEINLSTCTGIDVMLDLNEPNCAGDSTGSIQVNPLTGIAPYLFLWETGDTSARLSSVPAGNYMVTVTDSSGCTMAVSAFLPDAVPLAIELQEEEGTVMGNGRISATVSGGMMPYSYEWSNGATTANIENLENGLYELTITDANGCSQMASGIINISDCTLGLLDTLGQSLELDTISCLSTGELCLPIPLDSMVNYSLFLDGASYMEQLVGCDFDTFFAYTYFTLPGRGEAGPYQLTQWEVNGVNYVAEFSDITILVDSMNVWDPDGNWQLRPEIVILQGGTPKNAYGQMIIETPGTNSLTTLDLNVNLTPKGTKVSFSSGPHELVLVSKTTTCADTLLISQPCQDFIERDTSIIVNLLVGQMDTLSLQEILGVDISVSENQCPNLSGDHALIELDNQLLEIQISALLTGTDEGCYLIQNAAGEIINLQLIVQVNEEINCIDLFESDTLALIATGCQNLEVCLPVPYDSLISYGITDNGTVYSGISGPCSDGLGAVLLFQEVLFHELVFTNNKGCKDTLFLALHAPDCDKDLELRDTIEVGENGRSCAEITGLPGAIQTVRDICMDFNGEMVLFTIVGTTACIDYTGVELGQDSACIEICDTYGFCDTIPLNVLVSSGDFPPPDFDAVDDTVQTFLNETVVFNALGNDIFSTLDDLYLSSQPDNGNALFNMDGTIEYMPNEGFCNDTLPEIFSYAICKSGICDTAQVFVYVSCNQDSEFEIFTGISPNGDGVNDFFQINGIDKYPNNDLKIYNRWGNMVYSTRGYKNEWNGDWGNQSKKLPDGTYFYLLNDGEGKKYCGYLEIQR